MFARGSNRLDRFNWMAALVAGALAFLPMSAFAQSGGRVAIVRDAEIESLIRDYAAPIIKAAGLANSGIEVILVNDPSFNAFVTGRRMFIHTGALLASETPNEIIGVIAHEIGHIVGGHQFRMRERLDGARTLAVMSSLLGIGAVAVGAATGERELTQLGSGIATGGGELAKRGLLAYQRDEERAADRTALELLAKTGQSGAGMLVTLERLAQNVKLNASRVDPYQMSHPLPSERVENLRNDVLSSPTFANMDKPGLQQRHDMMRAKIAAYTQGAGAVTRIFRDKGSLAARYGDAISTHLSGNPAAAAKKAEALIKGQPDNAYFRELLGEALMRANKPDAAAEAFGRAAKAANGRAAAMMRVQQGQALVAAGEHAAALRILTTAVDQDRTNAGGFAALAQAHAALGEVGEAELATAEMHFIQGARRDAQVFAIRAQQKLKAGTPEWRRAQDIISAPQRG